jgi:hypothetical protein
MSHKNPSLQIQNSGCRLSLLCSAKKVFGLWVHGNLALVDTAPNGHVVQVASELARREGLVFETAEVVSSRSNTLVRFRPLPIIARVAAGTQVVRKGTAWLGREIVVTKHLAAKGAPTVNPAATVNPGPFDCRGLAITFWKWVETSPTPADPLQAGAALRVCHEALIYFPQRFAEWAVLNEADRRRESLRSEGTLVTKDAETLRNVSNAVWRLVRRLDQPLRTIHGDAHLQNVLSTDAGVLWSDWEDTFCGPIEWDLACLVASSRVFGLNVERCSAALQAYGGGFDEGALEVLIAARTYQACVWTALFSRRNVGIEGGFTARLEWLRQRLL